MVNVSNKPTEDKMITTTSSTSPSYLILEDGTVFKGYSFGYESDSEGEIGMINFNKCYAFFPRSDKELKHFLTLFSILDWYDRLCGKFD